MGSLLKSKAVPDFIFICCYFEINLQIKRLSVFEKQIGLKEQSRILGMAIVRVSLPLGRDLYHFLYNGLMFPCTRCFRQTNSPCLVMTIHDVFPSGTMKV